MGGQRYTELGVVTTSLWGFGPSPLGPPPLCLPVHLSHPPLPSDATCKRKVGPGSEGGGWGCSGLLGCGWFRGRTGPPPDMGRGLPRGKQS